MAPEKALEESLVYLVFDIAAREATLRRMTAQKDNDTPLEDLVFLDKVINGDRPASIDFLAILCAAEGARFVPYANAGYIQDIAASVVEKYPVDQVLPLLRALKILIKAETLHDQENPSLIHHIQKQQDGSLSLTLTPLGLVIRNFMIVKGENADNRKRVMRENLVNSLHTALHPGLG